MDDHVYEKCVDVVVMDMLLADAQERAAAIAVREAIQTGVDRPLELFALALANERLAKIEHRRTYLAGLCSGLLLSMCDYDQDLAEFMAPYVKQDAAARRSAMIGLSIDEVDKILAGVRPAVH